MSALLPLGLFGAIIGLPSVKARSGPTPGAPRAAVVPKDKAAVAVGISGNSEISVVTGSTERTVPFTRDRDGKIEATASGAWPMHWRGRITDVDGGWILSSRELDVAVLGADPRELSPDPVARIAGRFEFYSDPPSAFPLVDGRLVDFDGRGRFKISGVGAGSIESSAGGDVLVRDTGDRLGPVRSTIDGMLIDGRRPSGAGFLLVRAPTSPVFGVGTRWTIPALPAPFVRAFDDMLGDDGRPSPLSRFAALAAVFLFGAAAARWGPPLKVSPATSFAAAIAAAIALFPLPGLTIVTTLVAATARRFAVVAAVWSVTRLIFGAALPLVEYAVVVAVVIVSSIDTLRTLLRKIDV